MILKKKSQVQSHHWGGSNRKKTCLRLAVQLLQPNIETRVQSAILSQKKKKKVDNTLNVDLWLPHIHINVHICTLMCMYTNTHHITHTYTSKERVSCSEDKRDQRCRVRFPALHKLGVVLSPFNTTQKMEAEGVQGHPQLFGAK